MTNRINLLVGMLAGILLAVIVAAMAIMVMERPVQAQTDATAGTRHVTVVGHGEIKGTPDTATVEIGVETKASTTSEALDKNNTQVEKVIEKLTELGIEEKDIQTTRFNIQARYDNDGREIEGYTVSNIVMVTIRNLNQTGALLDEVVDVGANRVYGISFRVEEPDALIDQARDEALADARAKAEQLAQGSNANLGEVLVITENIGQPGPVPMVERAMPAAESLQSDVPIQTGEQTFNAQVQVSFALE